MKKIVLLLISLTSIFIIANHSVLAGEILSEDFEDGVLDNRVTINTVGSFSESPGIKNITNFGSTKAFGYGRSTCGASCFDNYYMSFVITFSEPTFVSDIYFKEMELYGNWGSKGHVIIDGVWLTQPESFDFGRTPSNDGIADTTYRDQTFQIYEVVTTIELRVRDITSSSEIFLDDLIVYGAPDPTLDISPPSGKYVSTQAFDLSLIVAAYGVSVVGGSATLDGSDVIDALAACVITGTLVSGGQTFRCPRLTGSSLGTGTHTLDITLDLSDGSTVSDNIIWEVKENTEP